MKKETKKIPSLVSMGKEYEWKILDKSDLELNFVSSKGIFGLGDEWSTQSIKKAILFTELNPQFRVGNYLHNERILWNNIINNLECSCEEVENKISKRLIHILRWIKDYIGYNATLKGKLYLSREGCGEKKSILPLLGVKQDPFSIIISVKAKL